MQSVALKKLHKYDRLAAAAAAKTTTNKHEYGYYGKHYKLSMSRTTHRTCAMLYSMHRSAASDRMVSRVKPTIVG